MKKSLICVNRREGRSEYIPAYLFA